jgi:hypothetical protein
VTKRPEFTLTWRDPRDAKEIAYVLEAAARRCDPPDRGFLDDAQELWRQIKAWEASQRPDPDAPGLRLAVTLR